MKDGALAPGIAGLVVGVAFVLLLGASSSGAGFWLWQPSPFPDPSYYAPLIQLKITGLKETYEVGERINFAVSQKAAGCVFPDTVVVKNLETNDVIWRFNSTHANMVLFGCMSMAYNPAESGMTMNTRDEPPVIAHRAGPHVVIAEHQHKKVQQEFRVVN